MTHDTDDWDAADRAALRDLAREVPPPPEALEHVIDGLRGAGLLHARGRGRRAWLAGAAASAAAFAGGVFFARPGPPPATPARPQFVVLLYGAADGDAAEQARQTGEIRSWARGLAKDGHALSGAKLSAEEFALGAGGGPSAGDLGGYIVLAADGPEQALALARTCPHLRHGGRIVMRPVDPT